MPDHIKQIREALTNLKSATKPLWIDFALGRLRLVCNPAAMTALLARLDAAEKDANRLKFMSSCEAQICWNRETGMCSIWRIENEDNEDAQWMRLAKGNFGTYQEAIDAAIAQEVK